MPDTPSRTSRRYGFHTSAISNIHDRLGGPTYKVYEHYQRVKALYDRYPYNDDKISQRLIKTIVNAITADSDPPLSHRFNSEVADTVISVLVHEDILFAPPPPQIPSDAPVQWTNTYVKNDLTTRETFFTHATDIIAEIAAQTLAIFQVIIKTAPAGIYEKPSATQMPLIEMARQPEEIINTIISLIISSPKVGPDISVFPYHVDKIQENIYRISGYKPEEINTVKNPKLIKPSQSKLTPVEMVKAYLHGTAFEKLLLMEVPFAIPERIRMEHTHILAGSGHGKTTLITQQIFDDLKKDCPPAMIVVDGKGTFVKELQQLEIMNDPNRVMIINPQDLQFPPALNMFAPRFDNAPAEMAQKLENNTISNFEYIFGARDFKLTAKQATCLAYCVRLLLSYRPVPTIHTLLDLMGDPISKGGGVPETSRFKAHIDKQTPIVQRFFNDLFYHPTEYGETKRQIQNRVFDLLEHPAFAAMFSTTECKLDLFDVIQNRKILLVDSSPSSLGEKAAPLLGRYIIALTLSAAYARLGLPRSEWNPAYLIVDEAQMFVDEEKTQPLLQQAREFNLGVTLAHQKLADLTPTLTATLAANTSIRYVGGVSALDAAFMARNMGCEPDFIMGQRKTATETHFACHVRGYTESAVSLTTKLGILQAAPQMNDAAQRRFVERNRLAIAASAKPDISPSPPQSATLPPEPAPILEAAVESPAVDPLAVGPLAADPPAATEIAAQPAPEQPKKSLWRRRW